MKRHHMKPFFMNYDAEKFPKNMEPSPRMREIAQVQILMNSNICNIYRYAIYLNTTRQKERERESEREREREDRERERERNRENMCEMRC